MAAAVTERGEPAGREKGYDLRALFYGGVIVAINCPIFRTKIMRRRARRYPALV
jgi:hypothetical protein